MDIDIQTAYAKERARVMLALLSEGRSLDSVGKMHGITRERVRQLVSKHYPAEYAALPALKKRRAA